MLYFVALNRTNVNFSSVFLVSIYYLHVPYMRDKMVEQLDN